MYNPLHIIDSVYIFQDEKKLPLAIFSSSHIYAIVGGAHAKAIAPYIHETCVSHQLQ